MSLEQSIKILVIGGESQDLNAIAHALSGITDVPVLTGFEPGPKEGLDHLKSTTIDLLFVEAQHMASDPAQIIGIIRIYAPVASIVVFGGIDDEMQALRLIRAGVDEVFSRAEMEERGFHKMVGRTVRRAMARQNSLPNVSEVALKNSLDGTVCYDLSHRIIAWNPAMERMFDIPRASVLGQRAAEVLPYFQKSGEEALLAECLQGRSTVGTEQSFMRGKSQKKIYFRALYHPVRNDIGQVIGAISIVRNTGELRIVKQQMLEQEEKIRQMADASHDLLWMSKEDGERIFFNKRFFDFTGISNEQAKNSGWSKGIYEPHKQHFRDQYAKAVANGEAFHLEYRLKRADGQYCWILDSGTPLFVDEKLIGYIGTCTDMNETRTPQVPAAQNNNVGMTSGVLDNSPLGFWKLDCNFDVLNANAAVAKQLGVDAEQLVGKQFSEIIPSVAAATLAAVVFKGERIHLAGRPITLKQNDTERQAYWDVTAWPLRGEENTIKGVAISTMEVTDRHKKAQQKEDFVATLVHDLKTPLIGADRTLDTLINGRLGVVDTGQAEVLSMLKRSNHSLLIMIQNLIEVYRYENEKPTLSFEKLDLDNIAASCVRELAAWAEHKGITLSANLPKNLAQATGDRMAIRRLLLNLIDNAIKFTAEGGSITVSAAPAGSAVLLHVTDTGCGIPEAEREKLFKRYSQGERGKSAAGTGLGLYLCFQIVKAHRGAITCESAEGVGTTFSVMLPLKPEEGLGSTSGIFQVVSP